MKVLLLLAKGFETMEFSVFVDVIGWARNDYHYDIDVITCSFSRTVVSTFGISVIVDRLIDVAEFGANIVGLPIVVDDNVITEFLTILFDEVIVQIHI